MERYLKQELRIPDFSLCEFPAKDGSSEALASDAIT